MTILCLLLCAAQGAGGAVIAVPHGEVPFQSVAGATLSVAAPDATPAERVAAQLRCDGSADEIEIQLALDQLAGHGGSVHLTSGTFQVDVPIVLRGRVALGGTGSGTVVKATPAFTSGEGLLEGAYDGTGTPLELVTVSDLTLDGNKWQGASAGGIHLDIDSKVGFQFGSPDAHVRIRDVLVARASGHGVHIEGSFNRAARIARIRVWDVDGIGFLIASPDGNYTDCDTGSSGSHGFQVTSANNHFTACKAWYSNGDGFRIDSVRTTLSGCTAQDNEQHGFNIQAGMNTFTACHADSNSYLGTGAMPDPNQGLFDGFHVAAGNVSMSSCFAYDKNEGGRGRNQRYGTFVAGNFQRLNLQVSNGNSGSHDNFTDGIGGTLTGSGNRIVATGQNEYVSP